MSAIRTSCLCALLFALVAAPLAQGQMRAVDDRVATEAVFNRHCEALLLRQIRSARKEILVAIYLLTRAPVADALIERAERGISVHIKYDAAQAASTSAMSKQLTRLRKAGVVCTPIRFGDRAGQMHHKFVVIDGTRVLTGSYNFTLAAITVNDENLVLIESPTMAAAFARTFEGIKSRSQKEKRR